MNVGSLVELVIMNGGNVESKKYELVPPDGGWGYVIFLSFILNVSASTGFIGCFGMLFNDFMVEIEMGSTGVTLLTGINAFCLAICGFFTSSLLKLMSRRKLALLSALLLDAGALGMIFAQSTATFIICQGVLPGISLGVTYNVCCSVLNEYFDKKRVFAFSFVQTIVGILSMIAPLFVRWSLDEYGFRGTLALIAALMLNNIFAVLLMHPVEWHMKRVEVSRTDEMQPFLSEEKANTAVVIKLTDESVESESTQKVAEHIIFEAEKPSKISTFIETFVDVSFFKKYVLSCVCLGPAVANFSESTFTMILPQALYNNGWNQDMVALAISLYGFGDLAMRLALIFVSKWMLKIGSQEIYILGLVLATCSRLGMIWSEKEIPIYIYIVMMGVGRCFICVVFTVVVSDVVAPDMFTQAMGISMLTTGGIILVIGPAIGAIRDLTNSYSTAFYLLTSFFAITVLFWSIELIYRKKVGNTLKETQTRSIQNKG